jgi:DNA-binding PadR family transcriptional regulator
LLILVSISDSPKHGYAIMSDVEALSGHSLGPGTLYAALARMEARGLIEALPADDRRRPYRITAAGVTALNALLDGLAAIVRTARRRLSTETP